MSGSRLVWDMRTSFTSYWNSPNCQLVCLSYRQVDLARSITHYLVFLSENIWPDKLDKFEISSLITQISVYRVSTTRHLVPNKSNSQVSISHNLVSLPETMWLAQIQSNNNSTNLIVPTKSTTSFNNSSSKVLVLSRSNLPIPAARLLDVFLSRIRQFLRSTPSSSHSIICLRSYSYLVIWLALTLHTLPSNGYTEYNVV